MGSIECSNKTCETLLCQNNTKKRVAIITMFHNSTNYGGILQAFALQRTIKKLGFECDVIRYSKDKNRYVINYIKRELNLKRSRTQKISFIYDLITRTLKYGFRNVFEVIVKKIYLDKKISLRKEKFSYFNENNISSTILYSDDTICECVDDYDIFVCGSDQIWNPKGFTPAYFLDFVPDNKIKVAYAPSIALDSLQKNDIEFMGPLINRLDGISIREERGKELVEMLTKKQVHWVLDPTLLLEPDFWEKVIHPYPIKKPYLFCYMLGVCQKNKNFLLKVRKKLNLPMVTIPFVNNNIISLTYGDLLIYDAGPGEFLSLIRDAEYVITDSFHGIVFSIIFRKSFFGLKRSNDDSNSSMNSRVYSLLKVCHLEHRLINDIMKFDLARFEEEIDYKNVLGDLDKKRKLSMEFLKRVLILHKRE